MGKTFLEIHINWLQQPNLTRCMMMKSRPTVYLIKRTRSRNELAYFVCGGGLRHRRCKPWPRAPQALNPTPIICTYKYSYLIQREIYKRTTNRQGQDNAHFHFDATQLNWYERSHLCQFERLEHNALTNVTRGVSTRKLHVSTIHCDKYSLNAFPHRELIIYTGH
jgi:hypothetical protein